MVLHGGPAVQHEYLRPEFDALQNVATVIYYDQRGCGKSESADIYEWQKHVKDLDRLIKQLSNKQQVFLAGSSWGSLLAILYAYSHPENIKGVILSGTVIWKGTDMSKNKYRASYTKSIEYFRKNKPDLVPMLLEEQKIVSYEDSLNNIVQDTLDINKEVQWLRGQPSIITLKSMVTAPYFSSLKNITLPILIFDGTRKVCGNIDWGHRYADIFPNAELFTINGACHDPWFSDPEKFFNKSIAFIEANSQTEAIINH
ncbi:alpha/beta fold hydrolase [Chondrinema litorale]|uniref:alpha/beta fold hydrolase n=1 Tax=Chondrinema litorale TaxID=2994555 RepID=UPI0025426CF7|nr:alpha/beta fold hydrolase [Chondrinema litorale]UZR99786.1 alpha/beta fold hydrolase [Chondrinema litorale]